MSEAQRKSIKSIFQKISDALSAKATHTNTGRPIDPELHNTVGRMAPFNTGGQDGLRLEDGFAYRTVDPREVRSIHDEGFMITDPSIEGQKKKARGQTKKKMFSELNPDKPHVSYSTGSTILKVDKGKMNLGGFGKPIRASDVQVVTFGDGGWRARSVPEYLGEPTGLGVYMPPRTTQHEGDLAAGTILSAGAAGAAGAAYRSSWSQKKESQRK